MHPRRLAGITEINFRNLSAPSLCPIQSALQCHSDYKSTLRSAHALSHRSGQKICEFNSINLSAIRHCRLHHPKPYIFMGRWSEGISCSASAASTHIMRLYEILLCVRRSRTNTDSRASSSSSSSRISSSKLWLFHSSTYKLCCCECLAPFGRCGWLRADIALCARDNTRGRCKGHDTEPQKAPCCGFQHFLCEIVNRFA